MTTLKNVWNAVKSVAIQVGKTVRNAAVKVWATVQNNLGFIIGI